MKVFKILKHGLIIWWSHSPAELHRYLRKWLSMKRQKRHPKIKKINLGGGSLSIDGYINIDRCKEADIVHDILNPLPIESDSVEVIVMSHALNYFSYEEAKFVVAEIYRVLQKGGIIRASFPDLRIFAKAYVENDIDFLFQKLPTGEDRFVGKTIGDKFISEAYFYGGVKYFFDFESAAEIFKEAGFKQIKKCQYRKSKIPEIDKIDNRPELSCYLEAVK